MNNEIFAVATREKYRFPYNGQISTEDLWDLTPAQLDRVYRALKKDQKNSNEESLMATRTSEDSAIDNKIALVKFVFDTKDSEKREAIIKAEREAQKKRVREIIASKKDDALKNMSIEELEKLL